MQAQPWVSGWAPQNCLPSNTKALNRDKTTSKQGVQWGRAASVHSEGSRWRASGIGYWLSPVCLCLPPQTVPLLETDVGAGTYLSKRGFWREKNKGEKFHMEKERKHGCVKQVKGASNSVPGT